MHGSASNSDRGGGTSSRPGAVTTDTARELEVAVRAWAVPGYMRRPGRHRSTRSRRDLGPSEWVLVFDTETTVDLSLRLRVGCYQLRRNGRVREKGLFVDP